MGGSGLGLSLVKQPVKLHGGTVEFRNEGRGRGSEITFALPLSRSAAAPVTTSSERITPFRRILLIEDRPDEAEALVVPHRMAVVVTRT